MRKDVRLGLGVGGILFAVVLVYALFFAGDRKTIGEGQGESNQQANAGASVTGESSAGGAARGNAPAAKSNAGGSVTSATPTPAVPSNSSNSPVQVTQTPNASSVSGSSSGSTETTSKAEIARPTEAASSKTSGSSTAKGEPAESGASVAVGGASRGSTPSYHTPSSIGQWDWNKALQTGAQVPAVTETPGGGRDPLASRGTPTAPKVKITEGGTSTGSASGTGSGASSGAGSVAANGKYVVKSGETFWTIAKIVYGDASYFAHIQRANPRITPKGLKAGTTINLPARDEVVPPGASAVTENSSRAPVSVDPTRQYKVRSGDNLSNICERLYGNTANVDKLYQLNKDLIGPSPSALKLNMVLQLPEAPKRQIAGAQ